MPDTLSTLGVVVKQTGVNEAKAELIGYGNAGDAASQKVVDSFRQASQAGQQMAQTMNVSQRAAQQMGITLDQVAAAANGDAAAMSALAQATNQATVAANQNAAAMTRMTAPSVTFRREADQLTAALARMSAPAVSFRREIEQVTRMAPPAVSGFRQLAEVQEKTGVASRVLNAEIDATFHVSHSAVIGLGELARGVGKVAESGTVGAFAMREFGGAATRLGSELGAYGGLAGVFVILGGVIVETFMKARHEMEETRKKFEEEIAKMANNGQITQLQQKMRDLLYGQPFDDKNKLRAISKFVQGAFEGSLADLEAHFAALEAKLPRDATMAPRDIAEEYNKVSRALDEARTKFADLRTAALNVASQPSEMSGLLPVITVEKITDAQKELEAQAKFTAESMDRITASLKASDPEWTLNRENYERTTAALKELNSVASQVSEIGARNKAATDAEDRTRADSIKQANKYTDDLHKIWRDGVAKITTDGFKSFLDFAEDLNQLFTRLMDKMVERARQLGKEAGGAGYNALGIGAAALTGGVVGYQSGSVGAGIIGGALAGNAAFPGWGSVAGALAGAGGALLGAADAHDKAAAALREAARQLSDSVNSYVTGSFGDDTQSRLLANEQQYTNLFNDLRRAMESGAISAGDWAKKTVELNAANQRYIDAILAETAAKKKAEEAARAQIEQANQQNTYLRILNATGQDDAAFEYQQFLEMQKAMEDGLSGVGQALLLQAQAAEKAQREREKQTQILQDQLSTAQQQYDALKQTVDSLNAFKSSLAVGQYSPLSPRQQLDAARGQLNTLYQSALGGDQGAAGQFSGVAQQFLEASRRYNASGAGYVLDYNSVNVMTDKLTEQFGRQMTDAQKQVSLLQQQLDALKTIEVNTTTIAQRPLTPSIPTPVPVGGSGPRLDPGAAANATISAEGFSAVVAAVAENTAAVKENTTLTKRGLDGLRSATANRKAS